MVLGCRSGFALLWNSLPVLRHMSTASTLTSCTQALRPPYAPSHLVSGTNAFTHACAHARSHTHMSACRCSSPSHAKIHTHLRPVTHPHTSTTCLCSAHSLTTPWRSSLASPNACPLPRNDSSKTNSFRGKKHMPNTAWGPYESPDLVSPTPLI